MHFVLAHLHHAALAFALIPGSLLFVVVALWRAARRLAGFKEPTLPLRLPGGAVVYTRADWRALTKIQFPYRYAMFETFPRWLSRIWRRVRKTWTPWSTRDIILHKAFTAFCSWAEANSDFVNGAVSDLDDEGPTQRLLARKAEIQSLYRWWKVVRPARIERIEERPVDVREYDAVEFEMDDQHSLARLANIWRDLV